jgi:SAM-dependent methyltransferase
VANAYDEGFYDVIRAGTQQSAAVVVPAVLAEIPARTVVDVGCGEGWWALEFAARGCQVLGLDGAYVHGSPLGDRFRAWDLATPLPDDLGTFDLAVCLEVAEHLPPERAAGFISDLCRLAPTVAFSAAVPGQGGVGHVNEQPPGYWVDHFAVHGFEVSGALRWGLWDDNRVEVWYRQNLLVATSTPDDFPGLFDTPLAAPHYLVHPILFDARRPR